jgi:hypothetical protein
MATPRFPCRVCGRPTAGIDAYVACADCLLEYERLARERDGDGVTHLPEIAGEVEERLRQLIDGP